MATARQFQTPVSWGMGDSIFSWSRAPIGGFGQPKELSGVVIGDSSPANDYRQILVTDVDADKMTDILFYPKSWTVSFSTSGSATDAQYGTTPDGSETGSIDGEFTAAANGKFGSLQITESTAIIWSTNKQPTEVLGRAYVFDTASTHATSSHDANMSKFYKVVIARAYPWDVDYVNQVVTCEDASAVESGRATYTSQGSAIVKKRYSGVNVGDALPNRYHPRVSIDKIYYKPNGKCDVLITFETYLYGGSTSWFAYGSTAWGGGPRAGHLQAKLLRPPF